MHFPALTAAITVLAVSTAWLDAQTDETYTPEVFGFTHDDMYPLRWDSVKLRAGEGRSEGLSAGPPGQVLKELRDASLLLVRIPPSCFLDVLHYGRSRWRLVQFPPLRDARLATRALVTTLYLRGRRCTAAVAARRPPMREPSKNARTATSVAAGTPTMCQPGTYGW